MGGYLKQVQSAHDFVDSQPNARALVEQLMAHIKRTYEMPHYCESRTGAFIFGYDDNETSRLEDIDLEDLLSKYIFQNHGAIKQGSFQVNIGEITIEIDLSKYALPKKSSARTTFFARRIAEAQTYDKAVQLYNKKLKCTMFGTWRQRTEPRRKASKQAAQEFWVGLLGKNSRAKIVATPLPETKKSSPLDNKENGTNENTFVTIHDYTPR